jgi:hypothetical protein
MDEFGLVGYLELIYSLCACIFYATLSPFLIVVARLSTGIFEAVSATDTDIFALAVQGHPEWPRPIDSFNTKIFQAFGDACRKMLFLQNYMESWK